MAHESTTKRASKRYARDMFVAMLLYTACVFSAVYAIKLLDLPQPVVIVLALAPVLPALLGLRAYLTFLAAMDEYQRRLQTDALLMATGIIVFGSFAWGFLEEWADLPRISLLWIFPAFAATFGVAHCIIRLMNK